MKSAVIQPASCLPVDKSLLAPCAVEIGLVSDGHYALVDAPSSAEFPSRKKQAARLNVALALVKACEPLRFVHLGDLTQEPPESPLYEIAQQEGFALFAAHGVQPVWVPGNHDVGDKPDPTMAAMVVNDPFLRLFEKNYGPQWSQIALDGVRLIFLNSQILSSGLDSEARQKQWLETTLEKFAPGERAILFLHLPPFLSDPEEPDLGNYDNLPKPERRWLMDLCSRYPVEWVLSGHVHQRFLNRIGNTKFVTCASPAFTRPTFGHMFASEPPPDQGRDDTPKEGIYLLRMLESGTDLHFIRTNGATDMDDLVTKGGSLVLTPPARDLADPRLGITLLHPLTQISKLPIAWHSSVRVPVRNDYPLLALEELAPAFLRVPAEDIACPLTRGRLELLRERGSRIETFQIWNVKDPGQWPRDMSGVELVEWQLPGRVPSVEELKVLKRHAPSWNGPLRLSPIFPRDKVAGKQHHRTRYAWFLSEIDELCHMFRSAELIPDRIMVQPESGRDLVDWAREYAAFRSPFPLGLDILLSLQAMDDEINLRRAVEGVLAAYSREGGRIYVQPLQDFDRSMDVMHGLLDTRCNPRCTFTALKLTHAFASAGRLDPASGIEATTDNQNLPGAFELTWLDLKQGCRGSASIFAGKKGFYLPVDRPSGQR